MSEIQALEIETAECPRCERSATITDLAEFRGICHSCFKSLSYSARATHRKRVDAEISEAAEHASTHPSRDDMVDNGHASSKGEYFDNSKFLDEVDEALGLVKKAPRDVKKMTAELFSELSVWIWSGRATPKSALAKYCALAMSVRPDLVERTYQQVGAEIGLTKQNMSKAALRFSDAFGIQSRRQRGKDARDHMSSRAMGHAPTNTKGTNGKPARAVGNVA